MAIVQKRADDYISPRICVDNSRGQERLGTQLLGDRSSAAKPRAMCVEMNSFCLEFTSDVRAQVCFCSSSSSVSVAHLTS